VTKVVGVFVRFRAPLLEKYLKLPQIHLGIDPNFSMKKWRTARNQIGKYTADDINGVVSTWLLWSANSCPNPRDPSFTQRHARGL
jgi:hypothetical protein